MDISSLKRPNFSPSEFFDSETANRLKISNTPSQTLQNQILNNLNLVADKLQDFRDFVEKPISINSGYRCSALNNAVKGSKLSRHLLGLAADIKINGLSSSEVLKLFLDSGINFDKALVERGCLHIQFQEKESANRRIAADAKLVNGEWVLSNRRKV